MNNYVAYIIDGAGNFQRSSAVKTICDNSHCTVSYSDGDFLSWQNSFKRDWMIKFVDLFAGVEACDLVVKKHSIVIDTEYVLSSEIDKPACKVYEANFGDNPLGDIQHIDESKISDFDLLLAGFPCQPFSCWA